MTLDLPLESKQYQRKILQVIHTLELLGELQFLKWEHLKILLQEQ
jgi:hypothetical protein